MERRYGGFGGLAAVALTAFPLLWACGGDDAGSQQSASGGAGVGGSATGGAGVGGGTTGGVGTGGAGVGGAVTGGTATGGSLPTGGVGTGGTGPTGGVSPLGGAPSGGVSPLGGALTGGSTPGGAETGGLATGGEAPTGGTGTGGTETGGAQTGGTAGAGGEAGALGTGGSTGLTLVGEIDRGGGSYVLEFGEIYFEVDANNGGRIVSFSRGGTEMLMQADPLVGAPDADSQDNFGATFWTSPQTMWNWPPVDAIDSGTYTGTVDATSFTLTGPEATVGSAQVVIVKHFAADLERGMVLAEYTIENHGTAAVTMAAWEIPRVPTQGITFFPTGDGTRPVTDMTVLDPSSTAAGATWYDWATVTPAGTDMGKYISDGRGWLAHANSGLLMLRTFDDIGLDEGAEGECEIKIYASGEWDYAEIEAQGAATSIAAGSGLTWTAYWQLVPIPDTVVVETGSQTLVDFAAATAAAAPNGG